MPKAVPQPHSKNPVGRFFPGVLGLLLGIALLKFGNPPIMEKWVTAPENIYEFLIGTMWPISWGYWMLAAVCLTGIRPGFWKPTCPRWLAFLPLAWLGWQVLATTRSINFALSIQTGIHFAATTVCFYLGLLGLSKARNTRPLWIALASAFAVVLAVGWAQHFGGLQRTREYFFTYIYPTLKEPSPDYLKKVNSDRIFGTLFYPNALAGLILLLLPGSLAFVWSLRSQFTVGARSLLLSILTAGALGCLYWSGSKGGAILLLLSGVAALLRMRFPRKLKLVIAVFIVLAGTMGLYWKYAAYFEKGATSVGARLDYWKAALQTVGKHPVFGTGPGTFGTAYDRVKRPESEPARLTHNDYLEQASDSGVPGFLLYLSFIAGALAWSFPRVPRSTDRSANNRVNPPSYPGNPEEDWLTFAVWLGVAAWCVQGLIEFGLYIPALSWTAFALLGWLAGTRIRIDKPTAEL